MAEVQWGLDRAGGHGAGQALSEAVGIWTDPYAFVADRVGVRPATDA